jgi:hypothetical protein
MTEYKSRDAIHYLQRKWEPLGISISADTFYHAVSRSKRQYKRVRAGKSWRYIFTEADLNEMVFYGPSHSAFKPHYDPVEVTCESDLARLSAQYGELVNEEGLIKLLQSKYDVTYSVKTLRQRLYRKGLAYAGYSRVGKHCQHWFPIEQLKRARFFPHLVKKD